MAENQAPLPVTAYRGDAPYVFVSYAHEDSRVVLVELQRLQRVGIPLWYDKGIDPGTQWRAELARSIERASAFLYFLSPRSAASSVCWSEVNFALDEGIPILTIRLEEFQIPSPIRFALSDRQALTADSTGAHGGRVLQWLSENLPEKSVEQIPPAGSLPEFPTDNAVVPFFKRRELVGREVELKRLQQVFADSLHQVSTRTIVISGDSGIGKSALVEEFLGSVGAEVLPLKSTCHPGKSVPFNAFQELTLAIADLLKAQPGLQRVIPRNSGALVRLFPQLEAVAAVPTRSSVSSADTSVVKRQAFSKMRDLLERLSEHQPLVLWLENFHWADAESRELLDSLLGAADPPPLLCLIGQPGEQLSDQFTCEKLKLLPLALNESMRLAEQVLGEEPLPSNLDVLLQQTDGSPFLIELLARALAVTDSSDGSVTTSETPDFESLITRPVKDLSNDARELLSCLAVYGQPIGVDLLETLFPNCDVASCCNLLEERELVHSGLTSGAKLIDISHNRIRQAISNGLTHKQRRELHLCIADALSKRKSSDVYALYWHYRSAGEIQPAFNYLLQAAEAATAQLAFDRATDYYEQALRLRNDQSARLYPALAASLVNAGDTACGAEKYLVASALTDDTDTAHTYLGLAAFNFVTSGHFDEGIKVYRPVLQHYRLHFPSTQTRALRWIYKCLGVVGRSGLNYAEIDEAQVDTLLATRVDVCDAIARGLYVVDTARGVYFAMMALLLALKCGHRERVLRALDLADSTGMIDQAGNQIRNNANRILEAERVLAKERGDSRFLARSFVNSAQKLLLKGAWEAARNECDISLRLIRETGHNLLWEFNTSTMTRLRALDEMGEFQSMLDAANDFASSATAKGDFYAIATGKLYAAYPLLAADNIDMARSLTEEVAGMWSGVDFHMQHFYIFRLRLSCDLYEGDLASATQRLAEFAPRIRESGLLGVPMINIDYMLLVARLEILTAMAEARTAECERQINAIQRQARRDCAAHAHLIRACCAALAGEKRSSADHLTEAMEGFARLDMHLWSAYAKARLAQVLQGSEAEILLQEAEQTLRQQNIGNIDRWLALQLPGFPTSRPTLNSESSQPI